MEGRRRHPRRHPTAAALLLLAAGVLVSACGANGEGAPPDAGCPVGTVNSCTSPTPEPSTATSGSSSSTSAAKDPCFTAPTPSPVPGGDAFCTSVVISTTLPDGLAYGDIKQGTGPSPKQGQQVTVQYTGWLQSTGQMFDSSRLPGRSPFQFTIGGQVIPGWNEGVPTMQVGGKRRFIIPASLAYGAQGSPPTIPPNATLVFDIELLSIG
ncbi:MAG TPA: FKBP-type peptidyl-prolyl cis-trans isomerase [Candidatus Dormibacteraeota bacterium]|nr:FKBP-type peptidyl-prolyl cis-trans isomerase [Candidatus Dormibacteraeota bacterium]